jgi:hypothetical protein
MAVALAELYRDRPRLPGKSILKSPKKISSLSDEYLNWVFGIVPLASDLNDLRTAINNSEAILSQYQRDSGRHVRRRYVFPETKDVVVTDLGLNKIQPVALTGIEPWGTAVPLELETTTSRKIWFSGCFMYHLPGGDTLYEKVRRAQIEINKLYGLKVDADVAYNLVQFSWLADWFGSLGSVIHNASNFALSNQVMHYGYVMATTTVTKRYTLRTAGINGMQSDLIQEFGTVIKQRHKATPYGFGLNPQTFTDQQWAILAALGISRGSKFLGVDL